MPNKAKWIAITTVFEPAIIYPLLNTTYSPKDIRPIDFCSLQMKCSALRLNRNLSLILIPRLGPCSGRLKGEAMIYLLTDSVRIKAWAKTNSGRFIKRYVYKVLSRVYNFYKL
jgi:hypothetical protein